jgi:predicted naringenin-chalcone synthase
MNEKVIREPEGESPIIPGAKKHTARRTPGYQVEADNRRCFEMPKDMQLNKLIPAAFAKISDEREAILVEALRTALNQKYTALIIDELVTWCIDNEITEAEEAFMFLRLGLHLSAQKVILEMPGCPCAKDLIKALDPYTDFHGPTNQVPVHKS